MRLRCGESMIQLTFRGYSSTTFVSPLFADTFTVLLRSFIERKIQLQNVDAWFAE